MKTRTNYLNVSFQSHYLNLEENGDGLKFWCTLLGKSVITLYHVFGFKNYEVFENGGLEELPQNFLSQVLQSYQTTNHFHCLKKIWPMVKSRTLSQSERKWPLFEVWTYFTRQKCKNIYVKTEKT